MACDLTTGYIVGCRDNMGGIREFYIANRTATYDANVNASGTVVSFDGSLTWYQYQPRKQSSTWSESPQGSDENGTITYEQACTIVLTRMEQSKQNELKLLGQGNLVIIVRDQNNKFFLLGDLNGMTLQDGTNGSGTAYGDRNGYELNFGGMEKDPAPEVYYEAFSADISATTGET